MSVIFGFNPKCRCIANNHNKLSSVNPFVFKRFTLVKRQSQERFRQENTPWMRNLFIMVHDTQLLALGCSLAKPIHLPAGFRGVGGNQTSQVKCARMLKSGERNLELWGISATCCTTVPVPPINYSQLILINSSWVICVSSQQQTHSARVLLVSLPFLRKVACDWQDLRERANLCAKHIPFGVTRTKKEIIRHQPLGKTWKKIYTAWASMRKEDQSSWLTMLIFSVQWIQTQHMPLVFYYQQDWK